MLTAEKLKDAGYKPFDHPLKQNYRPSYVTSWQKCFRDEEGYKKYYVNLDQWVGIGSGWNAYCQFNSHSDDKKPTFDVELHITKDMTLEYVEKWFENVWKKLKCDYYERD